MAAMGFAGLPAARASARGPAGSAGAFAASTFAEAMAALEAAPSPLITLEVPAIAENGASVPVTVSSALPGTREIVLLVDCNPQPAAAQFGFPAGTEPFVATRIRMAGSGAVVAAVLTDHGVFTASRAVEVIVGGCG
jgi:sulfur-oxidizing protein SoxY